MKIATLRRKARFDKPLEIPWRVSLCEDMIERARERPLHKKVLSKTTGKYIYYKSRGPLHSRKGKSLQTADAICNLGEALNMIRSIPQIANDDRRQWYDNYR